MNVTTKDHLIARVLRRVRTALRRLTRGRYVDDTPIVVGMIPETGELIYKPKR